MTETGGDSRPGDGSRQTKISALRTNGFSIVGYGRGARCTDVVALRPPFCSRPFVESTVKMCQPDNSFNSLKHQASLKTVAS
jgi:hypothetical protein